MTAESVQPSTRRRASTPVPLIGAVVFLLAYLAVGPVADRIAALPMPDAPTAEVYTYFTDHGAASIVTGVLQLVSAAGFVVFLCSALRHAVPSPHRCAARIVGWVAAVSIAVSSAIAIVLPLVAESLSPGSVEIGREVSFYAGGVVHVLALGGLMLTIGLWAAWSRPARIMAWIAAVPALASVASLAWYYASILLPAGRLLTMIGLIVTGASLVRGRSLGDGYDSPARDSLGRGEDSLR